MTNRIVSGIQPTGRMHLGNWMGAVSNWVSLQSTHQPVLFVANLHALTGLPQLADDMRHTTRQLVYDLLSCGIDPNRSILFCQSDVPAHSELHLILSMVTPIPWLERVPSYKDKRDALGEEWNHYGFLGYPVLQAADILLYHPTGVPVGKDQLPHLELTREIARRFNHRYGPILCEPVDMVTETPVLPGLDGRKMSKSYQNTIPMTATESEVEALVKSMVTDPKRVRKTDCGTPEQCPVFAYHQQFSTPEACQDVAQACRTASIGCVACKTQCATALNHYLYPIRERAHTVTNQTIDEVLESGRIQANQLAAHTMNQVKQAIGFS